MFTFISDSSLILIGVDQFQIRTDFVAKKNTERNKNSIIPKSKPRAMDFFGDTNEGGEAKIRD